MNSRTKSSETMADQDLKELGMEPAALDQLPDDEDDGCEACKM